MFVKGEIDNKVYIKLINYAFSKCDAISLTKYCNQNNQVSSHIVNIIMSLEKYTQADIMSKYSDQFLEYLYLKYLDNDSIFDDNYKNAYESNTYGIDSIVFEKIKFNNRKIYIQESIQWYIYDLLTSVWLKNNQNNILQKQIRHLKSADNYNIVYYIKLTDELRNEILNRGSLFEWKWPTTLEDISFFNNGYCWIHTVSHEKICEIYCESVKEYEYLKSIGVNFLNENFIPTLRENLSFKNYI